MRQWSSFRVDCRWNSTCHWNQPSMGSRCGLPQTAPTATSWGLRSTIGKNTTEHGLGARVVKTLTSDLNGKYHHVYFDNYFTSLELLEDLEKDNIYACGTARKYRKGFPPQLNKPNLKNRCVYISYVWKCVYIYVHECCACACVCAYACMQLTLLLYTRAHTYITLVHVCAFAIEECVYMYLTMKLVSCKYTRQHTWSLSLCTNLYLLVYMCVCMYVHRRCVHVICTW